MKAEELRISANELRIGNCVAIEHCRYGEPYLTIESIGLESVNFDFRAYSVGEIKPIPITEEWLVKFGFENRRGSFLIDIENEMDKWDYKTYLELEEAIDEWYCSLQYVDDGCKTNHSSPMPNLKYVHQLQNLYYALTGKELT